MEGRLACLWKQDGDDFDCTDEWATECGQRFIIMHGSPHENNMIFCCYCGGILREKKHESLGSSR